MEVFDAPIESQVHELTKNVTELNKKVEDLQGIMCRLIKLTTDIRKELYSTNPNQTNPFSNDKPKEKGSEMWT